VSVFWSFLADMFTTEQSKRLFGFVGVGGTLGGICGAAATAFLVKWVGDPFHMLLVSAGLLECAVVCVLVLNRIFGLSGRATVGRPLSDPCPECGHERAGLPAEDGIKRCPGCGMRSAGLLGRAGAGREPGPGVLAGVALVVRSRYMLLICAYLFLYAVMNTFLYMEQGRIVDAAVATREARTAFFAQMDLWTNVLTITTQVFLAGRLIRGLGVGRTLALLPLISALGFAVLWLVSRRAEGAPEGAARAAALHASLITLATFQVIRRGIHYAVSQPSRQILFTQLGPDEIYKSKPFIDTFVYRGGDLAGAWTPTVIVRWAALMGLGAASAVAGAAIPIALVSLVVGLGLGRMQARQRSRRGDPARQEPVGAPG